MKALSASATAAVMICGIVALSIMGCVGTEKREIATLRSFSPGVNEFKIDLPHRNSGWTIMFSGNFKQGDIDDIQLEVSMMNVGRDSIYVDRGRGKSALEPYKETTLFNGQLRELLEKGVGLLGIHVITYQGKISALLKVNIKEELKQEVKIYAYTSDAL